MIKNEKQLLTICFIFSTAVLLILIILHLISIVPSIIFKSILAGFLISIINFVLGLLLMKFSINKSEKIFLIALWGGMLFRLIFGLLLVLISFLFLEINTYGFIFSILFFYVFYLLIEIFYMNLWRKSHFGSN